MINYGMQKTDLAVKRAEWRLSRVYRQAARDIEDKMKAWEKGHAEREARYRQQVKDGKLSQKDFDAWMRGQVFQGQQWQARKKEIDEILLNADKAAANIVNEGKIGVFAQNYNYIGKEIKSESGISAQAKSGFTMVDQNTVARLIESDPQILPKAKEGVKKDKAYAYYNKLMNSAITQGIIQGESIPQIAKRIATVTGESNYKSAVRNARTAFTGAQNAGRMEGLHKAQQLGIKVKKQWVATNDNRTRDTHAELDGTIVDVDEPFVTTAGNEIMYPGDPTADASEVYNCRCTLVYVYEENENKIPTYDEWLEKRNNERNKVTVPTKEEYENRKTRLSFAADKQSKEDINSIIDELNIDNPIATKRDITNFYQYANETDGIWTSQDSHGNTLDHMTTKTQEAFDGLTDKLLDRMYDKDPDAERDFTEIKKLLNDTPLYISAYDRANIPDFNSYRLSSDNFVRTTFDSGALSIDSIYQDLIESYPGRFDTDVSKGDVAAKLEAINKGMSQMNYSRKVPIRDSMMNDDFEHMRDNLRMYLMATYEAVKSR